MNLDLLLALAGVLLIIAVVALPVLSAYYGAISLYRGYASTRWPTTSGKIVRSEVVRNPGLPGAGGGFFASIAFDYTVHGTSYRGKKYSLHEGCYQSTTVPEQLTRQYPLGSIVKVYYDPHKRSIAFLEPGLRSPLVYGFFLIFGVGMLLLGALCISRHGR